MIIRTPKHLMDEEYRLMQAITRASEAASKAIKYKHRASVRRKRFRAATEATVQAYRDLLAFWDKEGGPFV